MFFSPRSKAPLKEPKPKGTTRPNPADLPNFALNSLSKRITKTHAMKRFDPLEKTRQGLSF
ncbi:hypothetical protein CUP0943 [Campylobacter upsaliensis RM3195]|nr:hypothetical protein CUP0943 [Campylobacter upsaliensis RM3195]